MNLDTDFIYEDMQYDLVLCKLSEEPLQELHNIENFEIKKNHTNIDEISFTVPFYITNEMGEQEKNLLYDLVDGSMLVKLNEMQYFVLTKPEIKADESTGEKYKSITGFSREYEFGQKLLIGYEANSRKLFDHANEIDEDGLPIGFLNYITQNTSWTVDYINADIALKYRSLSFSKTTYLQAMIEVQKTFECIFQYNTIEKTISIYKPEQIGVDNGVLISDYNFIKNLSQTINHDEIKTRLYLRGKDNVSIQSINVTGQPFVEDYSFFMNTKYMTQELIDALVNYNSYVQTKQGQFEGYLAQLGDENSGLNKTLLDRKVELVALETELKIIQSNIDIAIADGQSLTSLKQQETAKESQISTKKGQISTVEGQINAVNSNINTLRGDIAKDNHFSQELLVELDTFVREDEFSDSNYTEDNLEEFLESGIKVLQKISRPKLQFNLEVEDFFSLVSGRKIRDRLTMGDIITLEYEELGFDIQVRLVGYIHKPDDNKLNLIFSNRDSVDDANIYLEDLLNSLTSSSGSVDFNKFKWNKGEDAESTISKYIDSALNLAKQEIVKAEGQRPIFDDRGLWLYKENPDGSIDPKQIRAVNNVIALTQDNWNTVGTAITPKGVVAETLFGKILAGAELTIETGNGDFKVDQNGVMIRDLDLQITQANGRSKIVMNANDGIEIHSKVGSAALSRKFYVDTNGKIQANDIEIGNTGLFKGSITIGTGNNVFKSDSNGIYLGNASFNSSPFRVSMDGTLNATKGNFSGSITGATGTFSGNLSGSTITGGSINIGSGNFTVNSSGYMDARNASIDGSIYADDLFLYSGGRYRSILDRWGETIDGNYLSNVTADTLSANAISAITIDANQITSGTIDADRISSNISEVASTLYVGGRGSNLGSVMFGSSAEIKGDRWGAGAGLTLSASDVGINAITTTINGDLYLPSRYDFYIGHRTLEEYILYVTR